MVIGCSASNRSRICKIGLYVTGRRDPFEAIFPKNASYSGSLGPDRF